MPFWPWLEDKSPHDRIKLWIAVRNRFVHSLRCVAKAQERERMITELGIRFDPEARMHLMPENCRALLKDVDAVGVAVAEKANVWQMGPVTDDA